MHTTLKGTLMCGVSIKKWDMSPHHLPPALKTMEDTPDALRKHFNDMKEQALPLLMCLFTEQHTVHGSRGTRVCNERSEWFVHLANPSLKLPW